MLSSLLFDSQQRRQLFQGPYPTDIAPTYLVISRSQFRVLAHLPQVLAPLSIFGSITIIYRILKFDRYEVDACNRRTYHRLLLAMSVCDVFGSLALMLGSIPVPRETMLEPAWGNTATCTAQGFFVHVFVNSVLYYNAGLMIYFVAAICFRWSEQKVATRLEPILHVLALFVPISHGIVGLFLEIYNPIGFGSFCGTSPYPVLCGAFDNNNNSNNACVRGRSAKLLYTIFSTIPESITLVIIYISIIMIYCAVRTQDRRAYAISGNRESVRARTRSVAVQSWLFAAIFFNTWVYTVLSPILAATAVVEQDVVRAQYVLSVLIATFLPLQGFFNFCIYIRPRFMRLRKEEQGQEQQHRSIWAALTMAAFGGKETSSAFTRRMSLQIIHQQQRRKSQQLAATMVPVSTEGVQSTTIINGDMFLHPESLEEKEHEKDDGGCGGVGMPSAVENGEFQKTSLDANNNNNDNDETSLVREVSGESTATETTTTTTTTSAESSVASQQ